MADNRKYAQLQPFTLAGSGATIAAVTVVLSSFNDIGGNALTMAAFGAKGFGTMEPGSQQQEEQIVFTGITTNANGTVTLTGVSTVDFLSPYTETSGLAKSHAGGTRFVISNTSGFYNGFANKEDDETIDGLWTFPSSEGARPRGAADTDTAVLPAYVTFGQLGRTSFSGTVNASTVQKGIVQEATLAQTTDGTAVGSTGARLYVNPSTLITATQQPVITTVTYGDTITAGQPVYFNVGTGRWVRAAASAPGTCFNTFGIALDSGVNGDTSKRVQYSGYITSLSGLTPGYVYVGDAAGTLSPSPGANSKLVGVATSATSMFIVGLSTLDVVSIFGVNADTSTINFNESMTFFANTAFSAANANALIQGIASPLTTLHSHKRTQFLATRLTDAASASITYAHGLGVAPNWVKATMIYTAAATEYYAQSFGEYVGGTQSVIYRYNTGAAVASDTANIIWAKITGDDQKGAFTSADATNITIAWTKVGTPSSYTMQIQFECGV